MGEEEKKMEEKKPEEKKEESKAEESKEAAPPQEIVLRVFMHCEGCAKKVRRCLKGFEGVEDVQTDCKAQKVVVKGEKADPVKVLERVQRKSHRQVELISPVPKPPAAAAEEEAKKIKEKEVASKSEEKKEEGITVVLKVHMHCEACAQEIKRRILRMNGVENVEPDLKSSQVTVKGAFDPSKLVEYVNKRTGKNVLIVKQEPEKKEEAEKGKEEKKAQKKGDEAEKGADKAAAATTTEGGDGSTSSSQVLDMKRSEFYPNHSQNYQIDPCQSRFDLNGYAPQMFSDENPNACSVM
ncbi:hypothetical protein RHSIM_Rhsim08G0191800 [Rhododendron simsii]|uniref:HMA domain-containing protein n=1 Tax=Rhododendron simsii TaxID=118357 RepID=A0A834GI54_RHOSS|nr:hypothetical protein RHSIM_Rhsim08G0191800 [Rhododendron simsii]